jgi:Arf-GAP/coiled-coil/ANK repeat/PH domain-containing protein
MDSNFQNNKLLYVKRSGEEITVMEDDLRICMVRPLMDIERRFCFEVISPTKSHILQADTEELYQVCLMIDSLISDKRLDF